MLRRRLALLPYVPSVLGWLVLVEVAVRRMPLPKLSTRLGVPLDSSEREAATTEPEAVTLTRWQAGQLRALRPLAARWPFADGPCLRQSLVAGHIVRHHHPVLRLGVATGATGVLAHAWVEVAGTQIGEQGPYAPLVNDGTS